MFTKICGKESAQEAGENEINSATTRSAENSAVRAEETVMIPALGSEDKALRLDKEYQMKIIQNTAKNARLHSGLPEPSLMRI